MARAQRRFSCQSCGAQAPRWAGRCESCGAWNTIVEEAGRHAGVGGAPKLVTATQGRAMPLGSLEGRTDAVERRRTGLAELDRVLGGGLVPGSAVLIGGDPGIGKSTLLLQAMALMAEAGEAAVYVSGEEAADQVRMRAERLGFSSAPVALGAETDLGAVLAALEQRDPPGAVVIDSIQTMWSGDLDSAPGTVSQVRAAAQALTRFAKASGAAVLLVGHVTKDGQIAGPRVVEHMVDTVLYFEGERANAFRILRAVKNRYGATDEIGVFAMAERGLEEVANPSALFLGDAERQAVGSAVFAGIEGTRPVLVEIQSLVASTSFGTPRRAVVGWDAGRLAMVLAVLEARCGLGFGGHDVYLNVAGGLRISEPAADLAVAAALISALTGVALPEASVLFGEISLSGSVREAGQTEARLKEAAKLGFEKAILARGARPQDLPLLISEIGQLSDLAALIDPAPERG